MIALISFLLLSLPSWGQQWEEVHPPSGEHLWDLVFVDEAVGYASGANHIMKTEDGGFTWNRISLPGTSEEYGSSIAFMNPQEGIVARNDLGLWVTEDGGSTWEVLNDTITGVSRRLMLNQYEQGWYLTDKQLWRTKGRGSWVLNPLELPPDRKTGRGLGMEAGDACCYRNDFRDMHWFDHEHGRNGIVAGGYQVDTGQADRHDYGRIFVTFDGGESWVQSEPYQPRMTRIGGILAFQDLLWIVGSGEQLYIGYPGFWKEILPRGGPGYDFPVRYMSGWAPSLNWWFSAGFILDEQTGWIAGTRILHTTDGGETWNLEYGPIDSDERVDVYNWITRMTRVGNRIMAVGWHGIILMRHIEDTPTSIRSVTWGQIKKEMAGE